jgi:hypothetical protein
MDTTDPTFVIANQGSTTPSLYVGGVNQNGFVGFGTTTIPSLASISIGGSTSASGSESAVTGVHSIYTFNPTGGGVQVGNRLVLQNQPTTATNTAVADLIRVIDNSGISNLVRGLDVNSAGGSNTWGVNTAIRGAGHTFGVQGITTGLAGGTSSPAALYGESTGTTEGDILRLYTSTMTTATSIARFYQTDSIFSGDGLIMDFARGNGTFNGNFLNFRINQNTVFSVASTGTTTIGQLNQTSVAAGLRIPYGSICVDDDGTCIGTTTGMVAADGFLTGSTNDLAEYFYSFGTLEAGDIVSIKGGIEVDKSASSSETIVGVVSTKPGFSLGAELGVPAGASKYPIGLAGRIPVKLSTENGPVNAGDKIILSSIPGVGMKYDPTVPATVIGVALEDFDGSSYLSEGTIDTEKTIEITGTTCSWQPVTDDVKAQGGGDLDNGSAVPANSSTQYIQVCEPIKEEVAPQSGSALTDSVNSQAVQIGKVLMFIGIDRSQLTVSNGTMPEFNGGNDLSLNGTSIWNIGGLSSASGKWSIDADGNLIAETILAKKGAFTESLEVGSQSTPSGVTIYDSITGEPTCLQIANGIISVSPDACAPTLPTNPSTNTSGGSSGGTTSTTTATTTTSTGSGSTGSTTSTTTSTTTPSGGSSGSSGSSTTATTTTTAIGSTQTNQATTTSTDPSTQTQTSNQPSSTSTTDPSTDPSSDPSTSQTMSSIPDPNSTAPSGT